MPRYFLSMKWKLNLAVSALMTAISIFMAAGIYSYLKRDYIAAVNDNRLLVVTTLATSAFESLLREDMSSIAFLGEQFVRQPDVLSVMVLDQGDKVVYDSRHRLEGKVLKRGPGALSVRPVMVDGVQASEIEVPFKAGEARLATARVIYSMGAVNKATAFIFKTIALFGIIGIAIGLITSSVLARWMTLPIKELTKGISAVESGDLEYRIRIESHDELERVGNEFNSMTATLKDVQEELRMEEEELRAANDELFNREKDLASRNSELQELNRRLDSMLTELRTTNRKLKDTQAELMEKEKMAAILELAGAAAHEINQPLTVIIGNIDLLLSQKEVDEAMVRKTLEIVNRSARDMADIVKKMAKIRRYETDSYVGKVRILDIDKSSRD